MKNGLALVNFRSKEFSKDGLHNWAAAGFKDTLLRWRMKLEVADGREKEIQS